MLIDFDPDDDEEKPERPQYLDNPIIKEYLHHLFHLTDSLFNRLDVDEDHPDEVYQLRNVLMTIFQRIATDGELEELVFILRMHFPSYFNAPNSNSIPDLTNLPLSTSN